MTDKLQAAKARVTDALVEFGQAERSIVTQGEVVDLLLDIQQFLAAVDRGVEEVGA